jgi:hypothetical protein
MAYKKYFPHLPLPIHAIPPPPPPLPPPTPFHNIQTRHPHQDFHLTHHDYLYQWQHDHLPNNMAIATLNLRGSPYSLQNNEPQFLYNLMTQLGINIMGITDAHLPPDLIDKTHTAIRRVFPPPYSNNYLPHNASDPQLLSSEHNGRPILHR